MRAPAAGLGVVTVCARRCCSSSRRVALVRPSLIAGDAITTGTTIIAIVLISMNFCFQVCSGAVSRASEP